MKWKVGAGVRVGFSYIHAHAVELGDGVVIGHLNVIRNVRRLSIGAGSYVANGNHAFGAAGPDFASTLTIGRHSRVMSRHFFDVAGTVSIGSGVTVGGRDTHVWSHTLRRAEGGGRRMEAVDVTIGDDVYVGARATLVGCRVPTHAFVAAGSVVVGRFEDGSDPVLLAGNPAEVRKRYPPRSPATSPANSPEIPPARPAA